MKNAILASTSTIYGSTYLEYLFPTLEHFFKEVSTILFIPYARPSGITYDAYTTIAANAFKNLHKNVVGIHTFTNTKEALTQAEAIFVGGGNTFVLVDTLYKLELMATLRKAILKGTPYLGTSAGTNICGLNMQTTNDMPIVQPISFTTLGILPFTINPHYLDADPKSTHKGETRATRIKEFHEFNNPTVIGLREGSWLRIIDKDIILKGTKTARIFIKDQPAIELAPNSKLEPANLT